MPSIVLSMLRSRSPRDTAFTVDMAASPFLHTDGTAIVSAHDKPKWAVILKVTEEKLVELLQYCIVYFDTKKKDYLESTRKAGSMTGKAGAFRIPDVRTAFCCCCVKIFVWPTVLQNHSERRATDLEAMFRRGAFDEKMKQVVSNMNEDFVPGDLPWVLPNEVPVQAGQETSKDTLQRQGAGQECIFMATVWQDFDTHA